mgnify:FL=1
MLQRIDNGTRSIVVTWFTLALIVIGALGGFASPVALAEGARKASPPRELAHLACLEDLLEVAVANSTSLQMANWELQAAQGTRSQVGAALKPQLNVAAQHKVENAANNLGAIAHINAQQVDPDDRFSSTMASLTWAQQLGASPTLKSAIQQADIGTEIANLRREQALAELVAQVQTGYHGVVRAHNGLKLAEAVREHTKLNVEAKEDQLFLGTATPLDVLKEKNAYLEAENGVQAARMGLELTTRALLQTMGLGEVSTEEVLTWAQGLAEANRPGIEKWDVDFDAAYTYALAARPELIMVGKQKAMAEIALDQVKEERDWTVKLAGQYGPNDKTILQSSIDSNRTLMTTVVRTEREELPPLTRDYPGGLGSYSSSGNGGLPEAPNLDVDPWQVELSLSYRFGDGGAKKAQLMAKEAALKKTGLQVELAKDGIRLELNSLWQELGQKWRAYQLALEGEKAAKETLSQLELLYELGSVTGKDVREGRIMVLQAESRVLDAHLSYEAHKCKLAVAMGISGETLAKAVARGQWDDVMANLGAVHFEK